MSYLVKVIEFKGQLCVPIPKELMEKLGWKVGDKVNVVYSRDLDGLTVKKIS